MRCGWMMTKIISYDSLYLRQLSLNNVIMPVFDHFGFIAPYYDRLIRRSKPEKLLAQIDPPVSGVLLDVGGGTGRVAETLLGRTERVIVADLSMGMLQQARVKNNLAPVCASSEIYLSRVISSTAFSWWMPFTMF